MPVHLIDTPIPPPKGRDQDPGSFGDEHFHCWLIPRLHRILADPDGVHEFPRLRRDCGELVFAYWEALFYMLRYLLAWKDIGRGLRWWYAKQQKQDHADPRLSLLNDIWDTDRQLDLFAAWAWERAGGEHRPVDDFLGPAWWASVLAQNPGFGIRYERDPYHGGTWPLHLGNIATEYGGRDSRLSFDLATRHAVLMLDSARGWLGALEKRGADLPDVGENSWYVDIVVKPVGWLGTFRRSRVTQLWFQGPHRFHIVGQ